MKRRRDPNQLDFFERLTEPLPPPVWDDPDAPHTDYVPASERCTRFLYGPGEASARTLVGALFRAMVALRDGLCDRAFTVYLGETGGDDAAFVVAAATTEGRVTRVLEEHLRVPGFRSVEAGDSRPIVARFRFDHGHVVEYAAPELAGTTWVDHARRHGTHVVVHRRVALPARGRLGYARLAAST
jgi:hypothetical protein